MNTHKIYFGIICGMVVLFAASNAFAQEPAVVEMSLKDHCFSPAQVMVKAGQKIKLVIHNQDSAPEEFDSYALNREKVIPAGKIGIVFIGPLKKGKYPFMGEFHQATAKGEVVAE